MSLLFPLVCFLLACLLFSLLSVARRSTFIASKNLTALFLARGIIHWRLQLVLYFHLGVEPGRTAMNFAWLDTA